MPSAIVGVLRVLLTANTAEFETALKSAGTTAKAWSKDLKKIGTEMTAVGQTLTAALTLPLAAIGGGAVKAAGDFEHAFADVRKTTQATTPELDKLALAIRDLSLHIPQTAVELSKIAALGGQFGVATEDLLSFTHTIADLGVAVDGLSTEEAAAGLAQIAKVTGTAYSDINKLASALVELGNRGSSTESTILEFSKRLSGAGHTIGLSAAEIMGLGAAMANLGINAEAGGTAMSRVMSKMELAVEKGGTALAKFAEVAKVSSEEFAATFKAKPIEAIEAFIAGMADAKASGESLSLLLEDMGMKDVRLVDSLKRLAGAHGEVATQVGLASAAYDEGQRHTEEAAKKYQTFWNQLKLLQNQITDVGIEFGKALIPMLERLVADLKPVVEWCKELAQSFAALPVGAQEFIVVLGLILAAMGPVLILIGQMSIGVGVLVGAFGTKGIAMRALIPIYEALKVAIADTYAMMLTLEGAMTFGLIGALYTLAVVIGKGEETWAQYFQRMADGLLQAENVAEDLKTVAADLPVPKGSEWEAFAGGLNQTAEALLKMVGPIAALKQEMATGVGVVWGDGFLVAETRIQAAREELDRANQALRDFTDIQKQQILEFREHGKNAHQIATEEMNLNEMAVAMFLKNEDKRQQAITKTATETQRAREEAEKFHATWSGAVAFEAAHKLTDEITRLGGATKLTDAEQQSANKVLQAAIDKWVVIGETGPEAVVALGIELDALLTKLKDNTAEAYLFGATLEKAMTQTPPPIFATGGTLPMPFGGTNVTGPLHPSVPQYRATTRDILTDALPKKDKVDEFDKALQGLSRSLSELAQVAGDSFGKIVAGLATVVSAMATARQAGTLMHDSITAPWTGKGADPVGNMMGMASGALAAAAAIGQATAAGSTFHRTMGGALAGAQAGAAFGPWGTAIGAIAGGLVGLVRGIGAVSEAILKARADLEKFQKDTLRTTATVDQQREAGGEAWKLDVITVRDAYLATGRTVEEALAIVRQMWNTDDPAKSKAAIEQINAVMREQGEIAAANKKAGEDAAAAAEAAAKAEEDRVAGVKDQITDLQGKLKTLHEDSIVDWKEMEDAAKKYGIDIGSLGPKFQGEKIASTAQDIVDTFDMLTENGASVGGVLFGMKDEIAALVQQSIKFKTDLPANMKPWVDELIRTGQLVDENGEKLVDLDKLHYGEPVVSKADQLKDEMKHVQEQIEELTASIAGPLIDAFKKIPAEINVKFDLQFNDPEVPAGGGTFTFTPHMAEGGIVTSPTLALIGEGRQPEAVVPLDRLRDLIGSEVTEHAGGLRPPIVVLPFIPMTDPYLAAEEAARQFKRRVGGDSHGMRAALEQVIDDWMRTYAKA